jgi:hypothetical protein
MITLVFHISSESKVVKQSRIVNLLASASNFCKSGLLWLILVSCSFQPVKEPINHQSISTSDESAALQSITPKASATLIQKLHSAFESILPTLLSKTQIPILLPTYIPGESDSSRIYALPESITTSKYIILLAYTEDCTGGTACRLGEVSGEQITSKKPPLKGDMISLEKGLTGYFTGATCGANCSDATLTWEQNGSRYMVAIKAGSVEILTRMANSAIATSISNHSLNKAQVLPSNINKRISTEGIGVARLGMTFSELKQKLGRNTEFKILSPFNVDFDAIAINQSGKTQYYILYPTGTTLTEFRPIEALLTDNSNYKTAEGIGPGTLLKQAEKWYGEATLSYNTSNESREYVKFANYPQHNIYFRPRSVGQGYSGIYTSLTREYSQTNNFEEGSYIKSIEVICSFKYCKKNN